MRAAVIGAGYVGLVQAAGLTHLGHTVTVGEVDGERVERLREGDIPIYEYGLETLVTRALGHGLLSFTDDNVEAVAGAEVVFLTLPTPQAPDGRADVSYIDRVVDELAPVVADGTILVTKSTVPVGTAERLRRRLEELGSGARIVSNPEFLREGTAVEDFLNAERIVIGSFDRADGERVAALYRGLESRILHTDPTSAELIKYGANAYLAARLTFANALANLAEHVGADILDVVEGIGLDRRIGPHFLRPGPGYGGSCFPKDTKALVAIAEDAGYDFELLRTVIEVNEQQPRIVVRRIDELVGGLDGSVIGMWGVAFKAGTDDTRESPALAIARLVREGGGSIRAYDPEASHPDVEMAVDPVDAVKGADLLLVATEWPEFMRVDLEQVAAVMRGSVVFDVRNLLDPEVVRAAGLRYYGWGRPRI